MNQWQQIDHDISQALAVNFTTSSHRSIGGGDINDAYIISNGETDYFVKLNAAHMETMFAAEAAGLEEIISSNSLHAPKPICWGSTESKSFIVMESLKLAGNNPTASAELGSQLALMHQKGAAEYGWKMPNTIGTTAQPNTKNSSWLDFFTNTRLGFQLALAKNNNCSHSLTSKGLQLMENVGVFFSDYSPAPSLLHGDLWSGNYGVMQSGHPVIFDPAVYYGDRETDLAMTELFGGFSREFYDAYNEALKLDAGYPVRKTLYNLYHILNHYNIFGGGYENQAENMINQLLSEAL